MRLEKALQVVAVDAKAAEQLDRSKFAQLDVTANREGAHAKELRDLVRRQIFALNRHPSPPAPARALRKVLGQVAVFCYTLLHLLIF